MSETNYGYDYNTPITNCSSDTPLKYFVSEAAADMSLAPGILLAKDSVQMSSMIADDCFDRETGYVSLLSEPTASTVLKLTFLKNKCIHGYLSDKHL